MDSGTRTKQLPFSTRLCGHRTRVAVQAVAKPRSVGNQRLVRDPGFGEAATLSSEFRSCLALVESQAL